MPSCRSRRCRSAVTSRAPMKTSRPRSSASASLTDHLGDASGLPPRCDRNDDGPHLVRPDRALPTVRRGGCTGVGGLRSRAPETHLARCRRADGARGGYRPLGVLHGTTLRSCWGARCCCRCPVTLVSPSSTTLPSSRRWCGATGSEPLGGRCGPCSLPDSLCGPRPAPEAERNAGNRPHNEPLRHGEHREAQHDPVPHGQERRRSGEDRPVADTLGCRQPRGER